MKSAPSDDRLERLRGRARVRMRAVVLFGFEKLFARLLEQGHRLRAVSVVVVLIVLQFIDHFLEVATNPSDVALAVTLVAPPQSGACAGPRRRPRWHGCGYGPCRSRDRRACFGEGGRSEQCCRCSHCGSQKVPTLHRYIYFLSV